MDGISESEPRYKKGQTIDFSDVDGKHAGTIIGITTTSAFGHTYEVEYIDDNTPVLRTKTAYINEGDLQQDLE